MGAALLVGGGGLVLGFFFAGVCFWGCWGRGGWGLSVWVGFFHYFEGFRLQYNPVDSCTGKSKELLCCRGLGVVVFLSRSSAKREYYPVHFHLPHSGSFSAPPPPFTNHFTELINLSAHFSSRLLLLPRTNWSLSDCIFINKSCSTREGCVEQSSWC